MFIPTFVPSGKSMDDNHQQDYVMPAPSRESYRTMYMKRVNTWFDLFIKASPTEKENIIKFLRELFDGESFEDMMVSDLVLERIQQYLEGLITC